MLNGVKLRMCPVDGLDTSGWQSPLGSYLGDDYSGYHGPAVPTFKNCGSKSTQGFVFRSTFNLPSGSPYNAYAACEFITNIIKTTFMDGNADLTTRRSDATNSGDRP